MSPPYLILCYPQTRVRVYQVSSCEEILEANIFFLIRLVLKVEPALELSEHTGSGAR